MTLEPADRSAAATDDAAHDPSCELCEAARLTDWYYEDDLCWVAECEACCVPMVVWKRHDPNPPEGIRVVLHARLSEVVVARFEGEHWVDDNMRSIPTHYHAHARPKRWGAAFQPRAVT